MNSIVINTTSVKNSITELNNVKRYYSNKKSTFSSGTFGYSAKLSNFLNKLQKNYDDISTNIDTISSFLTDYISDVESLERLSCGSYGYVKADGVSNIINKYKNILIPINLDSTLLFQITSFSHGRTAEYYDAVDSTVHTLATVATCGLSFLEGVVNVGEMIVDGGAVVVAGTCSILGLDGAANSISNFVRADWSKDLYYNVTSSTGLDQYADPDSTAANISSMVGNIAGMVGISILTGGAAASAFGAGTAAAATATSIAGGVIGAATNMGSESEAALQQGATVEDAVAVGVVAGAVGAATGWVSGGLDAAARAAGTNLGKIGLGQICKYALASFGVGASEPIINEMAHTVIYRNDEETGLVGSFINNSLEDNLLFQIGLAGLANAGGTVGNGIGGIKTYNYFNQKISDALVKASEGIETIIQVDNIDNLSDNLLNSADANKYIKFEIDGQIYSYIDILEKKGILDIKFSDYSLEQIKECFGFQKIYDNFLSLELDENVKYKLEQILNKGGYKDFGLTSEICNKDNPFIEAQRRISMAELLINNPETFDYFVENKVNLFHGTTSAALPNILKYGVNSVDESSSLGIKITTGEQWSRLNGKRDFVSFTDVLGIAEDYSEINYDNLSFPVIIGTSVENASIHGTYRVHSEVPEVGIKKLSSDNINVICVPSEKVNLVKSMVGDSNIKVMPIDTSKNKLYWTDPDSRAMFMLEEKFNVLKNKISNGYIEEASLFSDKKQNFLSSLFNHSGNISNKPLTEQQLAWLESINSHIKNGESVQLNVDSTTKLSSSFLTEIDDLSAVKVRILGGFADSNGNIKSKYNTQKYLDRITYTGYEALSITKRLEELQSMVDMNLPTLERAKQIYNIIASEVPVMRDYSSYADGHLVSASLRGLTDNNSVGKSGMVCAGYAQLFQELCTRCEIKSEYIRGTGIVDLISGSSGAHAWNVVIDGDNYIPVDVTWKASGGGEWFGASSDFAARHVADADEIFTTYSKGMSKVSSNHSLDSIISTMDAKYGKGSGFKALKKYLDTGNSNVITRTNGARDLLASLSIGDIENYVTSKENLDQTLQSIISIMDTKYGYGKGLTQLKAFAETGNYELITRTNGARDALYKISIDDVKKYLEEVSIFDTKYVMETDFIKTNANLSDAANDFVQRMKDSIGNKNKMDALCKEIRSYTIESMPDGFDTLLDFKKFVISELISSGALDSASGGFVYNLTLDPDYFKQLLGEARTSKYLIDNLEINSKLISPTLKNLNLEECNKLFSSDSLQQFFSTISDDSFLKIIKDFQSDDIFLYVDVDNIRNRFFSMSSDNFNSFVDLYRYKINSYLNSNRNSKTGLEFAKLISEKAANDNLIMSHPKLISNLANIVPTSNYLGKINDSMDEIAHSLLETENKFKQLLKSKLVASSAISLNENATFTGEKSKYYDVLYSVGDTDYTYTFEPSYDGNLDFSTMVKLKNLEQQVLSGELQIKSIKENTIKNNLILGTNGELALGLNEVTMKINGVEKTIVVKNEYGIVDVNYKANSIFGQNLESVEFISAKPIVSHNLQTTENKIFKLTYNKDGQQYSSYLIPKHGELDIDGYITLNNLVGIEDIQINPFEPSFSKLKNKLSLFNKNDSAKEIFSDIKYGGNQSDVRSLVWSKLQGTDLDSVSEVKSNRLINLIKSYFPNATDKEIRNIAFAYEKNGCGYMAVANATVSKFSSLENGAEQFQKIFGFELCENEITKSFNTEALALDIYLNSNSRELNSVDVTQFLSKAKGMNGLTSPNLVQQYFSNKGIQVNCSFSMIEDSDSMSANNLLLHKILQKNSEFSIITSDRFDLKQLNGSEFLKSNDGALQEATITDGILKNVGSHAMLITDITEENGFIVSSWSKKYEYLPTRDSSISMLALSFNI